MGLTGIAVATVLATTSGAAMRRDAGSMSPVVQSQARMALTSKAADKKRASEAPLGANDIRRLSATLATAGDRQVLTTAAEKLAASGQAQAVQALARFLADAGFLRRLDALDVPDLKLANLSQVLSALAVHPTEASEGLGLALLTSRDFQSDPDRNQGVLSVLASVRPMSERVERVFRQTNATGYRNSNALLLVANASPRALALFREMVADARIPQEDRVEMVRWGIPAHRHLPSVVESVALLLDRRLDAEVDQSLFQSLFDYGGDQWFGKARQPPVPQPWAKVETPVLRMYLDLGQRLLQQRAPLPAPMKAAIERTRREIDAEMAARKANQRQKAAAPGQ